MASYVVMEPPARGGGEEAVLVRDGFSLLAFLLPVVWLLFHRLWIEALIVFAVALALGGLANYAGFAAAPALSLLVAIWLGLEGASLRLAACRRRGWREWGVVEADNFRDAEIRYLAEARGGEGAAEGPWQATTAPAAKTRQDVAPALGLFSYPGRS